MAFTRVGNRDTFLQKAGYDTNNLPLAIESLQRDLEDGTLLRRYDLDTFGNRMRYNTQASPGLSPLIGVNSPAPNSPTYNTLDHIVVSQLDPITRTSPREVTTGGLADTIAQYLPVRDFFYHRDKQREVAKGLEDLYKELERVQQENTANHPTIPGATLTTKIKLTAEQAGKIISQRRYKAVRSTLEQLSVDLGYVGEVDITNTPVRPYAIPYPIPLTPGANPVYRTPTPDQIRDSYCSFTFDRALPRKLLQSIPDEVLAGVRTAAVTGVVASAAMGAVAPLAAYVGGRLASGVATSAISHAVRRNAANYSTQEDGLQNAAELAGRLGGLTAYGVTASAVAGGLALGYVSALLAGSAVTRYMGNRRRQETRNLQRQLEDITQTGGAVGTLPSQIDSTVLSAERYEAASATCDLLSLLGIAAGTLGKVHLPSAANSSPIIDDISVNHGNPGHIGVNSYKFDVHDKPAFGDHIEKVEVVQQNPDGSIVSGTTYPVGFLERMQHFFGDSSITEKDTFTASQPGTYNFAITATDSFGASTTEHFSVPVGGNGESTPVPVPPVPCEEGQVPYNVNLAHTKLDLREVYDYHTTPLKPEAGHEQGLDLKTGTVSIRGLHDQHTPCDFNVDDTVVMFEHYGDNTVGHHTFTDASQNTPDYRVIVDVDANGHFEIPKEFADFKNDDVQVTWATVTHTDCANGQLGLEDLASYTHGQHVVVSKEAVFSGDVPAHTPAHYFRCDADHAPKHPAPVDNNIHYYRIAPVPDHGAFLLNITDNKSDGLNNTTELYNGSTLVQWSQDTFAPGTTTALVGGHYPVDLAPRQYTVHSWGHDNPNIAWDNQQFTVDATQQHVAPAPMLDRMNPVSSEGLDALVTQETPLPAEQPAAQNPGDHIAPSSGQFINVETVPAEHPKAPEAPTNNCGCDGKRAELFVQDKEEAYASISYEDLLRIWQEKYTLFESSADTNDYRNAA